MNNHSDVVLLIEKKQMFFQDIIQKTVLHVKKNNLLGILSNEELVHCLHTFLEIGAKINALTSSFVQENVESAIQILQNVNNQLSAILKNVGTHSFDDLLWIYFGNTALPANDKLDLLKKYFHPTGFKTIDFISGSGSSSSGSNKKSCKKKAAAVDPDFQETSKNLETVDLEGSSQYSFYLKVFGIRVLVHNPEAKKTLIVTGLVDDILLSSLKNPFVLSKFKSIHENLPISSTFHTDAFTYFLKSLTLKDYIVHECYNIYSKYTAYLTDAVNDKQKPVYQLIKEFINQDLFQKRTMIIKLFLLKSEPDSDTDIFHMLAELLFNEQSPVLNVHDRALLLDSFPWSLKQFFKPTDGKTPILEQSYAAVTAAAPKPSLEQQICLLDTSDTVKEKAFRKLKEIKLKPDESSAKARDYLDGLLTIPFNVFRREPILNAMDDIKALFREKWGNSGISATSVDIVRKLEEFKGIVDIEMLSATELLELVKKINQHIADDPLLADAKKLKVSQNIRRADRIQQIREFHPEIVHQLTNPHYSTVKQIESKFQQIHDYMHTIKSTLDDAVHGHDPAKKQLERILGQWVNGTQEGYCFGFEGPPGVGKCFAKNTPIMLFSGEVKPVQDIAVGDQLMGDDSMPRIVVALGHGVEQMYRIHQANMGAKNYTVNESHILSLWCVDTKMPLDIPLLDYLALPAEVQRTLHGYKRAVDFEERPVDIDPYVFGCWLSSCDQIGALKQGIPPQYKFNSRAIRKQLVYGLRNSCGYHVDKDGENEHIVFDVKANQILAKDLDWVLQSLGYATATVVTDDSSIQVRVRLQLQGLKTTPIEVIPLEKGEYFGFQLSGGANFRFLLGDFTVAHNTSLAQKGLAKCLVDDKGVPRPFAMIQMGGDTNGSSLHGHNYTYLGSSWGSIVQILMDKKCMNPIIFIDEVDKISKTEHGREIVGILTHLLDPVQNNCFQDKYFAGIDLDLSKALFILSYNNAEEIDKILLDRIHRVKFKSLSLDEKLVICNRFLLPEIYTKMGLTGALHFSDDVLTYLIEQYTCEAGVRKIKELLFEIIGEINLAILKQSLISASSSSSTTPTIEVTVEDIRTHYFKDKQAIIPYKIHTENKIGIVNGLWANSIGQGGVLPIQASWRPSSGKGGLHLTGMQGDVMKESMYVGYTVAWNRTPDEKKGEDEKREIHVHCPDGATQKDGPSGGAAIAVVIYSLLNKMKVKAHVALTGEILLNGQITMIGGLEQKILGGIRAGVKEFLFPTENQHDFNQFMEQHEKKTTGVTFHAVKTIEDVFALVFE